MGLAVGMRRGGSRYWTRARLPITTAGDRAWMLRTERSACWDGRRAIRRCCGRRARWGETAFYPFLSGRDNLPRWPGGVGSAITEWTWCLDKPDWPNAPGTPWPATAAACGNGWAWPRRPLSGSFHLAFFEGEDGPRPRCLTRLESTGSQVLSRSSVLPVSG